MSIKISLAGNPNSGKTTMFNALTGSSQRVGNWPGVTVERKEGKLKNDPEIIIQDLPGIYSLSPYTLEEVVTRDYLISGQPDVIVNIVDAANLERNLYLTTQLAELNIPIIVTLNMIDAAAKSGITIDVEKLEKELKCPVISTSAVRGSDKDRYVFVAEQNTAAFGGSTLKLHKMEVTVAGEYGGTTSVQEDVTYYSIAYGEDRAISDGDAVMEYLD